MMMQLGKHPLRLACALLLLTLMLAGCTSAQTVATEDLTKDEGVLAEMQKRVDARNTKLGLDGKGPIKLNAHDVCINRFEESPKIIIVGFFAYDRGCELEGAFINSRYFEAGDAALSKAALDALGWESLNQQRREQLAKLWTEKGLLAFFTVIYAPEKDLEGHGFHPPQVVSNENGEIKVTLWIHLPSGMTPERGYQHLEYRFSRDGNLSGNTVLESFSLKIKAEG